MSGWIEDYNNDYINKDIKEEYQNDINNRDKSKKALKEKLVLYKETYPTRIISNYYLKKLYKFVTQMDFLPEYKVYEEISRKHELFEATMILPIKIKDIEYGIAFALVVNVSKLSRHIEEQNIGKLTFNMTDLKSIITDSYWDDYEKDNKIRLEKRDILAEEKAKNPIIIMPESEINRATIINGNHRIMYLAKNRENQVEGYYVTVEEICKFAITKDYEALYLKLIRLVGKI